jgi:1,2-diacylglycerol 3-alpha-glucosyltransferase
MKIGIFTESYLPSPDGVATSVAMTASQLTKLGHTVSIVAPNRPHSKEKKNIYRIVSVKILNKPEIWEALEIPQSALFALFQKDFDIIHIHSGGTITNIGWQIAKLHRIPLLMTYHTLWQYYAHYFPFSFLINPWMFRKFNLLFGNTCNALITPTEKVKHILKTYGIKKPIYVIPNGIALHTFSQAKKGYLRQKLHIPYTKSILLTVGRLEKEKSPDFILASFAHIAKQNPNVVLVFVGEGREKLILQNLAKQLHIFSQIYFTGAVPYTIMPQVYADADIFLFASKTETQGLAVYEALASGLPVVAVHDTAFTTILHDGFNGYISNKYPEHFAKKIAHLLKNKAQLNNFSRNAQKSVVPFSIENTVKQLEECYLTTIKSS